jgi:putative membrane protein
MLIIWRLLINAAALWAATRITPGISFDGDWRTLLVVALIFGVLNVSVRPLLWFMTLPLLIVTLGLFTFVLNALMLWLTGVLSRRRLRRGISRRSCRERGQLHAFVVRGREQTRTAPRRGLRASPPEFRIDGFTD